MNRNRVKRITKKLAILLVIFICILYSLNWFIEKDGAWRPEYTKVELESILGKEEFSEEDYHTVLLQTGLGRDATDELLKENIGNTRERVFEQYQDNFFSSGVYECRQIGMITNEERIRDRDGFPVKGFEIPSLENGDVIITKATHSIGWRHGHAAIVTDASKGETLEAILWGYNSVFQKTSKWQTYPTFILLRLKDDEADVADQIAQYAKKNIYDIPYGLFTGIPNKAPEGIKKTQCSHLVWYPYAHFGYDIDSDGSWLVTPKDIANSDSFEVVQVFGVNPDEIWP